MTKTKQLKAHCEKCGYITKLECEGSVVLERVLEGVIFKIHIVNNDLKASLPKNAYTRNLNIDKLQKDMIAYIKSDFPYTDSCYCPKCQETAIIANMTKDDWNLYDKAFQNGKLAVDKDNWYKRLEEIFKGK